MNINYRQYNGSNTAHKQFWEALTKFPPDQHILAFLDFFAQVKLEVESGMCTLREAGCALAPGQYDDAMNAGSYGGGITIGCGAAEELAGWIYADIEEAWDDWRIVVDALDGLVEIKNNGSS